MMLLAPAALPPIPPQPLQPQPPAGPRAQPAAPHPRTSRAGSLESLGTEPARAPSPDYEDPPASSGGATLLELGAPAPSAGAPRSLTPSYSPWSGGE